MNPSRRQHLWKVFPCLLRVGIGERARALQSSDLRVVATNSAEGALSAAALAKLKRGPEKEFRVAPFVRVALSLRASLFLRALELPFLAVSARTSPVA